MASGFGSGTSEEINVNMVGSTVQVNRRSAIIESLKSASDTIDRVTWNKKQCTSILHSCSAIVKGLEIMGLNSTSDGPEASDADLVYRKFQTVLKLVEGYHVAEGTINSLVVARQENREAFQELHEELGLLRAALGFQDLEGGVDSTLGTKGWLEDDAELDKDHILKQISAKPGKLEQVVSEKTAPHTKSGESNTTPLPSYLNIDPKSDSIIIDKVQRIRRVKRKSNRDPKEQDGWARVHSGTWLGCKFAIKKFKCGSPAIRAEWNETQLQREVGKLVELRHPHVVRLVGFGKSEAECVFVMELMDRALRELIDTRVDSKSNKPPFTDIEGLDIINQIAKGMYYMHTKGYAHGDLKCSNILVNEFGDNLEVKLSDFRGSQSLDKEWDPKAFEQASKTRRPRWTAPEAIDHYGGVQPTKELLKQSDTYSFGMTCFEILTGKLPFQDKFEKKEEGKEGPLLGLIKEGNPEKWNKFPSALDADLKGLIKSCWNKDPGQRPNFEKICYILDTICFKRHADGTSANASAVVKHMSAALEFQGESSTGNDDQGGNLELLRSKSFVKDDIPGYLMIPELELIRSEEIGKGRYGRVFKATWLGCTFAVKLLMRRGCNTADLQREVSKLIRVSRHPCVVQMVGLSENKVGDYQEYSIVMEYMDSNLRGLIASRMKSENKKKPFTFDEEVVIITKIAWGMAYLHYMGLVHLDLSPSNVLAKAKTVDVKIADFGASLLQDPSTTGNRKFYSGIGTGFYRAPEMLPPVNGEDLHPELPADGSLMDLEALKATDVYSFGMLCHEVLTGEAPWSHLRENDYAAARKGPYQPKWPSDSHPELKVLIERCWSMAPEKRPTFIEICKILPDISTPSSAPCA